MYCSKCGKEIRDDALICVGCGCATDNFQTNKRVIKQEPKTQKRWQRIVARILLILLFALFVAIVFMVFDMWKDIEILYLRQRIVYEEIGLY